MEPIGGEDPEAVYEFCCNIHILRAVKLVAIAGLVLNPFWAIYVLFSSPITPYDFSLVFLCLYALILVALQKDNARLLIPFLVFNGILIGGRLLYCIVLIVTINSGWFWAQWRKEHPGGNADLERAGLIVHLCINVAKVLLNIWFEHVIYRGYLFMLDNAEHTPLLATTTSPVQNAPAPTIVRATAPTGVHVSMPQPTAPPPEYRHVVEQEYYQQPA